MAATIVGLSLTLPCWLWWSSVQKLTDDSMRAIGESCPALQALNLGACYDVSEMGILFLARGCRDLQVIHPPLSGCASSPH
jgi:hypothetical protein